MTSTLPASRPVEPSLSDWFQVSHEAPGVYRISEPMHSEAVSSYLVVGDDDAALLDTGLGVVDMQALVAQIIQREPVVVQTHGHWDHIGSTWRFARRLIHPLETYTLQRGFPNAMYGPLFSMDRMAEAGRLPADFDPSTAAIPACEPTGELVEGDIVDLGGRQLEVLHTPGHSPGGISLLDRTRRVLFVGDAAHPGGMWLFLPRSDADGFGMAIEKLAAVAGEVDAVYGAHGTTPFDPAVLVAMRDAFREVRAGRAPDRVESRDIGFPEPVSVDAHAFEGFTFLLGTGRY